MIETQKNGLFLPSIKTRENLLTINMTDQRLNNLCLLAVEREMSHDLLSDPSSVTVRW